MRATDRDVRLWPSSFHSWCKALVRLPHCNNRYRTIVFEAKAEETRRSPLKQESIKKIMNLSLILCSYTIYSKKNGRNIIFIIITWTAVISSLYASHMT